MLVEVYRGGCLLPVSQLSRLGRVSQLLETRGMLFLFFCTCPSPGSPIPAEPLQDMITAVQWMVCDQQLQLQTVVFLLTDVTSVVFPLALKMLQEIPWQAHD